MSVLIDIDPITLEVVRHKLEGISTEMQETLLHCSFSSVVKEGLDASASIFNLNGETLSQACAIPVHLGTLIPAVQQTLRVFQPQDMVDGDIYILNDPYTGGTHLPDIALIKPVFSGNVPVALSATMSHHQDVGGMTPGSVPTNATEIFQEGLRIPPMKLIEAGKINEVLVALLRQNVRIPDTVMGDLNAQISSCNVGAARLNELIEELGCSEVLTICDRLLDRSEYMTRKVLSSLPDGTYHYVDYNDNDGLDLQNAIRIEVSVKVGNGSLHFDFDGSSQQVKGPFNCVPSGSLAAACFAVRAITDPEIPTNGGCFRPLTVNVPKGSVLNPNEPAAVNSRTATIKRVAGTILAALRPALPDKIPADPSGEMLVAMFGGMEAGSPYVVGEFIAGGSGATVNGDGVDVIETDVTNCMNLSVEAAESYAPLRVLQLSLRNGSGGNGRYRGGLGVVKEYLALADDIRFTHRGERHSFAPQGANGGGPGRMAVSQIMRASGESEIIPSKLVTTLNKGDRVLMETAGGGGNGVPSERLPAEIEEDNRNEKIQRNIGRENKAGTDNL